MRMPASDSPRATKRFSACAIALAVSLSANASGLGAQNLGPFRQFLALEGSYTRLQLDVGAADSRLGLDGYGGRLWINLAPFSGPNPNLIDRTALALIYFRAPRGNDGISTRHYGAEFDIYPLHVPIGNFIDPFVSLGLGSFRIDNRPGPVVLGGIAPGSRSNFALTPGVGIRVPIPNRFQLRLDARDLIAFNRRNASGESRTSHNPEFMAGLGLTF